MNRDISHLPEHKQEQLRRIVEIIREETDVEMIILFGSYAEGTWVEEPGPDPHSYKYQSDFDIYILTEDRKVARKATLWSRIEGRLRREVRTPVQILTDSVGAFNSYVGDGRYLYTDIRTKGILLYDSERFKLVAPRELTGPERHRRAEEEFEYWFRSAQSFLLNFQGAFDRADYPNAAFELHQVVERLYAAVLLVFTNYKPKLHDIDKLGHLAAGQAPKLLPVFPQGTEEEQRLFGLLRRAYVDARYEKGYSITKEELAWLAERVRMLQGITEEVCRKRIEQYRTGTL